MHIYHKNYISYTGKVTLTQRMADMAPPVISYTYTENGRHGNPRHQPLEADLLVAEPADTRPDKVPAQTAYRACLYFLSISNQNEHYAGPPISKYS